MSTIEIIILALFVVFALFSLGKNDTTGKNNYFTTLCAVIIVTVTWVILSPISWAYQVVALYATLFFIPVINWIRKKDGITSLLVRMKKYPERKKMAKLSINLRQGLILAIFVCCGGAAYVMSAGLPFFWKGIILAPAELIALAVTIWRIKEWLDNL